MTTWRVLADTRARARQRLFERTIPESRWVALPPPIRPRNDEGPPERAFVALHDAEGD